MRWFALGGTAAVVAAILGIGARAVDLPEPTLTPGFYPSSALIPRQESECYGEPPERFYEFYFTRAIYNDGGRGFGGFGGRRDWATDFPKADCQFVAVIKRLAGLDTYSDSWAIHLDDPKIRRYPFLYALEVGRNGGWRLTDGELKG